MEKVTDMELVLNLAYHIENPCESYVNGKKVSCLEGHLMLAKVALPRLSNPFAKRFLEIAIKKYSNL